VNLGILDAGEVVVIDTVESPQAVRMSSKVGNRRYFACHRLGEGVAGRAGGRRKYSGSCA